MVELKCIWFYVDCYKAAGCVEAVSNNWTEKGGQGTLKGPRRQKQAKKFTTSSLWGKGGGKKKKVSPFLHQFIYLFTSGSAFLLYILTWSLMPRK